MKYAYIAAEYATNKLGQAPDAPTITQMCTWLKVSKSGFYEWRDRPPSATAARHERLKAKILAIFDASDGTYGYRRIHAVLRRSGVHVGVELVRRLVRDLGLVACQPRPWRTTTVRDGQQATADDLVARDFTAPAPGTKLVGDITYVRTWEGWLYLATVIDCFNKEVIGYAMADHLRTELVVDALDMAARNHQLADGAMFHSDHGCQYTSAEFAGKLGALKLRRSLGRTGICYDNSMAESFFGMLKNERVYRTAYPTRKRAKRDIARYIEVFYNRQRLHSGLGYRTPHEVRAEYSDRQLAA